jgi:hypothetical protein
MNNDRAELLDLSVGIIGPTPDVPVLDASPSSIAAGVDATLVAAGETAAIESGGGQFEAATQAEGEGNDVLGLVVGVDDDTGKLVAAVKRATASLDPETRAAIEQATVALSDFVARHVAQM